MHIDWSTGLFNTNISEGMFKSKLFNRRNFRHALSFYIFLSVDEIEKKVRNETKKATNKTNNGFLQQCPSTTITTLK